MHRLTRAALALSAVALVTTGCAPTDTRDTDALGLPPHAIVLRPAVPADLPGGGYAVLTSATDTVATMNVSESHGLTTSLSLPEGEKTLAVGSAYILLCEAQPATEARDEPGANTGEWAAIVAGDDPDALSCAASDR